MGECLRKGQEAGAPVQNLQEHTQLLPPPNTTLQPDTTTPRQPPREQHYQEEKRCYPFSFVKKDTKCLGQITPVSFLEIPKLLSSLEQNEVNSFRQTLTRFNKKRDLGAIAAQLALSDESFDIFRNREDKLKMSLLVSKYNHAVQEKLGKFEEYVEFKLEGDGLKALMEVLKAGYALQQKRFALPDGLQGYFLVSSDGSDFNTGCHDAIGWEDEEPPSTILCSVFPGYCVGTDKQVLKREIVFPKRTQS